MGRDLHVGYHRWRLANKSVTCRDGIARSAAHGAARRRQFAARCDATILGKGRAPIDRDVRDPHPGGVPELRRFLEFEHRTDRATGQSDRRTVAGREGAVAQSRTRTAADRPGWTDPSPE